MYFFVMVLDTDSRNWFHAFFANDKVPGTMSWVQDVGSWRHISFAKKEHKNIEIITENQMKSKCWSSGIIYQCVHFVVDETGSIAMKRF